MAKRKADQRPSPLTGQPGRQTALKGRLAARLEKQRELVAERPAGVSLLAEKGGGRRSCQAGVELAGNGLVAIGAAVHDSGLHFRNVARARSAAVRRSSRRVRCFRCEASAQIHATIWLRPPPAQ
jgi:hypothetical protein